MPLTNQKNVATLIVGLLIAFGLVVLGMPSASLGQSREASQQTAAACTPSSTPSSSPTSTTSPSPSGSPAESKAIQWLNPSSNSNVISTKDDGTNTTYHLVAVVKCVPDNAVVEFKYQVGAANEVSLGLANRVGASDAYEIFWNGSGLGDGNITLKALLFSGGIELGRDEITAEVDNADSTLDPRAETVEIVVPPNGNNLGFYTIPGDTEPTAVVTVTSSGATGGTPPSTSSGTATIEIFYTLTPPGREPVWKSCSSAAARTATGRNQIRCKLAAGDKPIDVTGVAAKAAHAQTQLQPANAGDAHRVFGYVQQPTSVSVAPASQPGRAPGSCSDSTTATILDQHGQPVAGANVDVHAKGPSDNLRFDSGGAAHQGPDKAHTAPEQGWNCSGSASAGGQGDHELPPGDPDIKHIESTTGTNNDGKFDFRLYSPDGPGTTQFAVWADTDGDDLWCSTEPSKSGSLTWGSSTSPSPTPTTSPSSSPTSSPTGSPSGSPTSSGPSSFGPDKASCPAGSPSPTSTSTASPTASQSPSTAARTVTLDASRAKVLVGRPVTLSGDVASTNSSCTDAESVTIRRRIHGTDQFKSFKSDTTDSSGNFSLTFEPRRSADYEAQVAQTGSCGAATSAVEPVRVKVKVTIEASDRSVPSGGEVVLRGKVIPNHKGTKVVLQRKTASGWEKVAKDELSKRSRYRFEVAVSWDDERKFRVIWPKQHPDHIKGTSPTVVVRAT